MNECTGRPERMDGQLLSWNTFHHNIYWDYIEKYPLNLLLQKEKKCEERDAVLLAKASMAIAIKIKALKIQYDLRSGCWPSIQLTCDLFLIFNLSPCPLFSSLTFSIFIHCVDSFPTNQNYAKICAIYYQKFI